MAANGPSMFASGRRKLLVSHRSVPDCEHEITVWSCRSCKAKRGREDYQINKDRYFRLAKEYKVKLKKRIDELKSVPCADCKNTFDPVCMDFDHLPEFEKTKEISYMMRHRWAWSKIEAEIKKCEVVCANCHRLRSKNRMVADF